MGLKILLLKSRVVFQMSTNCLSDHGIFAHKDSSMVPQRTTNLLQLFGSDIVSTNNEAFRVFIKKLLFQRNQDIMRCKATIKVVYNLTTSLTKYPAFHEVLSSLPILNVGYQGFSKEVLRTEIERYKFQCLADNNQTRAQLLK